MDLSFDPSVDPMAKEVRHLQVITGECGRRRWSSDVKSRIILESMAPGAVVSEVARRHGLRPQQLFNWRSEVRAGRRPLPDETMTFVPVVASDAPCSSMSSNAVIDVHVDDVVIRAPADVTPEHLITVLRAVRSAR